jgi:hypothetical protein
MEGLVVSTPYKTFVDLVVVNKSTSVRYHQKCAQAVEYRV